MIDRLIRLKQGLVRGLEVAVMILMAALVLDVLWQIFTRFALNDPSPWTQEAATMLLIWCALLGASVAFARKAHLGVDLIVARLHPVSRRIAELYAHAVTAVFAVAVLVIGGTQLVLGTLGTNQLSPAMGIKMGYVYLALPISGLFILLFAAEAMFEAFVELEEEDRHG